MNMINRKLAELVRDDCNAITYLNRKFHEMREKTFNVMGCYTNIGTTVDFPSPEFLKFYTDEMNRK